MKEKEIRIKISNPCEQKWEEMPKVGQGLFCKECSKVVHDFTHMPEAEIIRILGQSAKGTVCGKFRNSQLEKSYYYPGPVKSKSYPALKLLLLGALSLRFPLESGAQVKPQLTQSVNKKALTTPEKINSIKGKIVNKTTKEGLAVAISLYKGTNTLTTTDLYATSFSNADGTYEIKLPDSGLHKFFTIVYTSENYFYARSVVVDKDHIPHYLPVRMTPFSGEYVDSFEYEGRTTGGVAEMSYERYETVVQMPVAEKPALPPKITRWKRMKLFFGKLFK